MNRKTGMAMTDRDHGAAAEGDRGQPCPAARDRGLREAIDDALRRGRRSLAQRLADAAARLTKTSPSLAGAIMRVRLQQSLPSAALSASENAARLTPELHLLRAVSYLGLGQGLEGHLELSHAAARSGLCPAGLQLLAHLEHRDGGRAEVRSLLNELRGCGGEQRALSLMLCDAIESGDGVRARELATALLRCAVYPGQRAEIETMLAALGVSAGSAQPLASPQQVSRLAAELTLAPATVGTLVEAQRRRFDAPSARLLRQALELAAERMIDPAQAHAAIVELTLMLDGPTVAETRVAAAIEAYPMSTLLRALLARIERCSTSHPARGHRAQPDRDHVIATIGGEEMQTRRRRSVAA